MYFNRHGFEARLNGKFGVRYRSMIKGLSCLYYVLSKVHHFFNEIHTFFNLFYYHIAGNFGGKNLRGSAILRHFVGNIFMVGACTAGKGRQGRFIRG